MVSPLSPSSGACSERQRCPLRSCHLQSNCLGDGTIGTKPDSEDDWKWVEYSFDFRKQAGSSTKCSWAKWLLIIFNSTLLLWALTGRSWFSMGCVGCVDVCAGEWAWHALLVPRLPLKHWNEWWESIAWGHSSCVQHWRLSFAFSFCPFLSLVSADLGLLQISGQLLSMVGISLKDEGLCSGANTLSQEHIVQGNKPWYSGCNFSCISTCLWRGSRWLCQVVPSEVPCWVTAGCKGRGEYSLLLYWLLMWLLLGQSRALGRMEQIAVESTLVCMSQSSVQQLV